MSHWKKRSRTEKSVMIAGTLLLAALFFASSIFRDQAPASADETSPLRHAPASIESAEPLAGATDSPPEEMPSEASPTPKVATGAESSRASALPALRPPQTPAPNDDASGPPPSPPSPPATVSAPARPSGLFRDFWLWFGLGVNFTSYTQSVPDMSEVSFGRIKAPSQMVRAGFFFDDRFGLDLGFKNTPGQAESGSAITVRNGSYEWKTMSAELLSRSATRETDGAWLLRAGVQHHEMPFLIPLEANVLEIRGNSLTAVSAGVEYRKLTRGNIRIESQLRYQHPVGGGVSAGTTLKIKPRFAFDGSVGAAVEARPNVFLGAYWYGQYHGYGFDFADNGVSFSGRQNLFFSNIDIRLGFEF